MLSDKKHKILTKLLESKKVRDLKAEIKRKDKEIIRNLKALVRYMERK